MNALSPADQLKMQAANAAAQQLRDGHVVGLGTGSTAAFFIDALGRLVADGLKILGISTSERSAEQARKVGVPLSDLGEYPEIDITVDGADEVELGTLNLIKGRGGALLREKIVATVSKRLIIVVDESKLSRRLGTLSSVPVEIVPFGWQSTAARLKSIGASGHLRITESGDAFVTDGGHYLVDCAFGVIEDVNRLQRQLDSIVGVVEHGLFLKMTSEVLVGTPDGVRTLKP